MPTLIPAASEIAETPASNSALVAWVCNAIRALEWIVLLAALSYLGFRVLPRAWNHLNTDFPNYYITARLLREGYSTRRVYEWVWMQRQKDLMGIAPSDQPVVGFVPHTPFSALLLYPLTSWPPLAAKHIWIVCNLLLLVAAGMLLRALTRLDWRRLVLLVGLSYPVFRNLEYGQYYIVILVLLTGALYLYVRQRRFAAGLLVGLAAGLKIFPVFFLLYFARKRDLRGALGLLAGTLATLSVSVWAFGTALHRTYFTQVLPWAMRGDAMNPYALSPNSISALLHRLLVFEPQWNPRPPVHAPVLYAILHPLIQFAILAVAIYLTSPTNRSVARLQLEWSAFLVALLTISTLPASYHFTLLVLPAAVLAALFLREERYVALGALALLYVGIGFPMWPHPPGEGCLALASVPRLYLLLCLCGLLYFCLYSHEPRIDSFRIDQRIWTAAFAAMLVLQVGSTLRHQRGLYDRYSERISLPADVLSASTPGFRNGDVDYIAMTGDGYRLASVGGESIPLISSAWDQLSHASVGDGMWLEEVGTKSDIVRVESDRTGRLEVEDAQFPVASPDGRFLAYLRDGKGRTSLWLRDLSDRGQPDKQLTSAGFDVEEMTFLPDGSLIFAAERNGRPSELYEVAPRKTIRALDVSAARYPAASPSGQWLAYSHLDLGVWNLWLVNLHTGEAQRITGAECNDISPTWQPDSKTLVYASDCGRALWFTALNRRKVLP